LQRVPQRSSEHVQLSSDHTREGERATATNLRALAWKRASNFRIDARVPVGGVLVFSSSAKFVSLSTVKEKSEMY